MKKYKICGNSRGIMLIVVLIIVALLSFLSAVMFSRMISEIRASQRHRESSEAFYLAEAGVDKAIAKLPGSTAAETRVVLGSGEYSLFLSTVSAQIGLI